MKKFEDFLESGDVRKQEKNEILSKSLMKSVEKSLKNIYRVKVDDLNAESVISEVYDIIRKFIDSILSLEGYKSYSHEASILFLRKFSIFAESEIIFLDNLRKIRNGIKYYGKEADIDSSLRSISFMNSIIPKLNKILRDLNKSKR